MSFRANLLKKMEIDNTAKTVLDSIRPVGSIHQVDKDGMTYLLECAGYTHEKKRDLDLYHKDLGDGRRRILVLDNDLSVYHTTLDDVVIRKSPYVKEMISIRNVIKILNDGDVVVSKKEASVRDIQKECIDTLDISFTENDLRDLEKSGVNALAVSDTDKVLETLFLFGEILGYSNPPKSFIVLGWTVLSRLVCMEDGTKLYGPIVLYNAGENELKLVDDQIRTVEKEKIAHLQKIASAKAEPDMDGGDVFAFLKQESEKIKI